MWNYAAILSIPAYITFSRYLFDEEATIAAHDKHGWFKTGDICRQEGEYIFIVGRASIDIIKSGGYKIGARGRKGVSRAALRPRSQRHGCRR